MTTYPERRLTIGGDPRTMADYAKLREEMHKLSHPARPDIDWLYAERLCLSLFDRNGVELQTAAWYTLARTQLTGLSGLNEGLAILETLITRQWGTFGHSRCMQEWKSSAGWVKGYSKCCVR